MALHVALDVADTDAMDKRGGQGAAMIRPVSLARPSLRPAWWFPELAALGEGLIRSGGTAPTALRTFTFRAGLRDPVLICDKPVADQRSDACFRGGMPPAARPLRDVRPTNRRRLKASGSGRDHLVRANARSRRQAASYARTQSDIA